MRCCNPDGGPRGPGKKSGQIRAFEETTNPLVMAMRATFNPRLPFLKNAAHLEMTSRVSSAAITASVPQINSPQPC
jgi:hypothetical protein